MALTQTGNATAFCCKSGKPRANIEDFNLGFNHLMRQ